MEANLHKLPPLQADLILLHAPAFFDFRNRRDVYFPFLGTSGDVPITPLYEYFPLGFKTLQRRLGEAGHAVKLINLSTVLLRYPQIDVDELFKAFDAPVVGIDLHWMVHVQGSLGVAERIKQLRPDIQTIFGGISSSYFADQLIQYPSIDMVMRGYETHEPMIQLLSAIKDGGDLSTVPNLLWKEDGEARDNGFTHAPETYGCGIDWSSQPQEAESQTLPILEFLSTQNAGCNFHCIWCGGSREAYKRIFGPTIARKPQSEIEYEFRTMKDLPGMDRYHFYSVGLYNEGRAGVDFFLDQVEHSDFKSISYEQFKLTPDDVLKRMVKANRKTTITLSPESHDIAISKLAGRGTYTNEELEAWLERAIEYGIEQVDIWYFVGMPGQDERSAMASAEYARHLLEKFKGTRVNPMVCPMIPFLDPASSAFVDPDKYGYRLFFKTVEEHRRGMERASIINRINYETKWLSREDLVRVGYRAVQACMEAKADNGFLPRSWVKHYNQKVDDALEFIGIVHEADCIADEKERAAELEKLGDDILRRNDEIFFHGVMNQAFPVNRAIGGRWFDELGWSAEQLERF